MPILTFIKLFLSLASSLAQYAHDKQLMEAGAAKSVLEGIKDVQAKMAIADNAIANIDELPVDSDPANRARKH